MDENDAAPKSGEAVSRRLDLRDAFYVLGLITLAVVVLRYTRELVVPIVFALLWWFLINVLADTLRRIPGLGRILPESLALAVAAVLTVYIGYGVGQIVFGNIADLGAGFEEFGPKADQAIIALETAIGFGFDFRVTPFLEGLELKDVPLMDWLPGITNALASTVSYLVLVALYTIFLLFDQPHFQAKMQALFEEQGRLERAREILQRISRDTRLYIRIMTAISVVVGLCTYGLAVYFGVPAPAFWGFLAFALNYIPTVGSLLGILIPSAYALVQLDNPVDVGLFVLALSAVQFTAGNLILPRVTGDQLNLSEFVVILSLTVFGSLWGVAGLFLGVPVVMVLVIVLSQFDSTRPFAILLSKTGQVVRTEH